MYQKKSLGQHFLTNKKVVTDMILVSGVSEKDVVLEIGPGKGILTESLLKRAQQVIAVEKDSRAIPLLKEKFEVAIENKKLIIHEADILEVPLEDLGLTDRSFTVIANIPYYITGALLKKFLSGHIQPAHITLLVQKEVADRITAQDKKESILSISIKVYGKPKKIKKVPAHFFSPEPKVDSAIITIEHISKEFFKEINEEIFFEIVRIGFSHKRKKVLSNLKKHFNNKNIEIIFIECEIPTDARAESLSLEKWHCLTKKYLD